MFYCILKLQFWNSKFDPFSVKIMLTSTKNRLGDPLGSLSAHRPLAAIWEPTISK